MFAGLNSEAYDRQYTDAQLVRRLASYLTPHKREARITVALILIITVIGLVDPLIISATLDAVGRNLGTTYAQQIILGLMALKLTFSFLIWLANLGRRRSTARVVADVISKMREDAFARVIRHDLSFFDKHQSGRI
ncbi:MAG TPA: ABC transporter transmembrane domain-containing protein, partial [Thermoflexales bacterium]|nr:ABC transporter transmembrane domain-containing protein [Thermoflexales bacterium]